MLVSLLALTKWATRLFLYFHAGVVGFARDRLWVNVAQYAHEVSHAVILTVITCDVSR